MSELREVDRKVLDFMLARPGTPCDELRAQLPYLSVRQFERSAMGFFTEFDVASGANPLTATPNLEIGNDVVATSPEVEVGIGFLLFVRNGFIDMLEGFTLTSDDWTKDESQIQICPEYRKPRH